MERTARRRIQRYQKRRYEWIGHSIVTSIIILHMGLRVYPRLHTSKRCPNICRKRAVTCSYLTSISLPWCPFYSHRTGQTRIPPSFLPNDWPFQGVSQVLASASTTRLNPALSTTNNEPSSQPHTNMQNSSGSYALPKTWRCLNGHDQLWWSSNPLYAILRDGVMEGGSVRDAWDMW